VDLHELVGIELRSLEDLHLADVNEGKGEDHLSILDDLLGDGLRDQFGNKGLQVAGRSLSGHDLEHLLADGLDLRGLSIGCLLDLVGTASSQTNGEQSQQVSVGGTDINVGLNESLPLADKGPVLVGGHGHSVEVGKAALSLDIIDAELELGPGLLLILVQVTKGNLNNTSLEVIRGNVGSDGLVDDSLANITVSEDGRGLDVVPFLAGEGVDNLLLSTLL